MTSPAGRTASAIARVGGRVLLIDADERVLLIHERIEAGQTHWLTPGGGVEADERPWQAAVREVYEETGLAVGLGPSAPEVLTTRRRWSWAGATYDQVDHFFVARVPNGLSVLPRGLTAVEQQTLLGHRWWSAGQLRATRECVVPAELADLLVRLAGGPATLA
jgi:8-oxo-dGTP pyrophosphatase MutT (NUDIX family)